LTDWVYDPWFQKWPMKKIDRRLRHLWRPYTQMHIEDPPLKAMATNGAEIILEDGSKLTDGIASWWTACHGYNHPKITEAIQKQLDIMPHVMFGGLTHEPALSLAKTLSNILPGAETEQALEHIFFCDSGSVAVEVALKMAVQFWYNKGQSERRKFICFRYAYHGDTMGAMSVCDPDEGMHSHFSGFFPEQIMVDLPRSSTAFCNFENLLNSRNKEIAGVILEPLVQGAGGMKFHDAEILSKIRNICSLQNILFIADEIATGFGRTGTMFACNQAAIAPDIICIGKAMTGGVISMAATAANKRVWKAFQTNKALDAFMHGPTYMANPLGCAAAQASISLFATGEWKNKVLALEKHFSSELKSCLKIPGIVDVRVKGAIGVVQVANGKNLPLLRKRFVEEGVWVRPFGDIVYLMPPFILNKQQMHHLTDSIIKVLEEWSKDY